MDTTDTTRATDVIDTHTRIERLLVWLDEAKAVPFSTSVMVGREAFAEELEMLDEQLPAELREAKLIIAERDEVLDHATREAERIHADAQTERQRLVSEAEVFIEAERQADEIIATARAEARRLRLEVDDYIDSKLAKFEIVLHKTLQTVEGGRARLADKLSGDGEGAATTEDSIDVTDAQDAEDAGAGLYDHEVM